MAGLDCRTQCKAKASSPQDGSQAVVLTKTQTLVLLDGPSKRRALVRMFKMVSSGQAEAITNGVCGALAVSFRAHLEVLAAAPLLPASAVVIVGPSSGV